jgi:glucose-6-phosphate isomerase
MKLMEPGVCRVDVARGELTGATNRYVKTLADLDGLYEDAAAFQSLKRKLGDEVVYEVTDFKPSANAGDMIIGVTRMRPGKVGREYFLTRGHIHANANRPEMYYGESGRGLMLLESPEGEIRTVEIEPRALCYVPPYWIHRSVNTGPDELVMTFAYPADSGQDYAIIEEAGGMRSRVVDDGEGGWTLVNNASYRGRPAARIARVFASAS